jgi:hypothetical protein
MTQPAPEPDAQSMTTYCDGYVGLFFELPGHPEDERWKWELWKGEELVDWEYAPSLTVCQRECPAYVRIHRYVTSRSRRVA